MNFDDLDMPDNAARLPLRKMSLDPFLTLNLEHLDLISTITERSSDQNKICEATDKFVQVDFSATDVNSSPQLTTSANSEFDLGDFNLYDFYDLANQIQDRKHLLQPSWNEQFLSETNISLGEETINNEQLTNNVQHDWEESKNIAQPTVIVQSAWQAPECNAQSAWTSFTSWQDPAAEAQPTFQVTEQNVQLINGTWQANADNAQITFQETEQNVQPVNDIWQANTANAQTTWHVTEQNVQPTYNTWQASAQPMWQEPTNIPVQREYKTTINQAEFIPTSNPDYDLQYNESFGQEEPKIIIVTEDGQTYEYALPQNSDQIKFESIDELMSFQDSIAVVGKYDNEENNQSFETLYPNMFAAQEGLETVEYVQIEAPQGSAAAVGVIEAESSEKKKRQRATLTPRQVTIR